MPPATSPSSMRCGSCDQYFGSNRCCLRPSLSACKQCAYAASTPVKVRIKKETERLRPSTSHLLHLPKQTFAGRSRDVRFGQVQTLAHDHHACTQPGLHWYKMPWWPNLLVHGR